MIYNLKATLTHSLTHTHATKYKAPFTQMQHYTCVRTRPTYYTYISTYVSVCVNVMFVIHRVSYQKNNFRTLFSSIIQPT